MEHSFWHERWQQGEIGFHQPKINSCLIKHWGKLGVAENANIFVPMCGKSSDMIWLSKQAGSVTGVEISELAVKNFFTENSLEVEVSELDGFKKYMSGNITILCGDFFILTKEHMKNISAIYDRASLIAMPPKMSVQYAKQLAEIVAKTAKSLLLTMEYQQEEMNGPPFSVTEEDVHNLFGKNFCIENICNEKMLELPEQLKARGLTHMKESVYILEKL